MDILISRKVIFVGDMVYKAIGFIAKRWAIFAAIFIYTTGTQHDKTRQGTTRDTTTAGAYSLFLPSKYILNDYFVGYVKRQGFTDGR